MDNFLAKLVGVTDVSTAQVDQRFDYDTDAMVLYAGVAPAGTDTGGRWTIRKFTYITVNSQKVVSLSQTAIGSWDARISLF